SYFPFPCNTHSHFPFHRALLPFPIPISPLPSIPLFHRALLPFPIPMQYPFSFPFPIPIPIINNTTFEKTCNRFQKLFTIEELALYNGTDDSLPILLGILGSVFDVTKGKSHYGAGGGYNHFAGRRWTYRFIARFIQHRGNDVFPLPFQGYDSYPSSFEETEYPKLPQPRTKQKRGEKLAKTRDKPVNKGETSKNEGRFLLFCSQI
ncbi:hypothetical protein ERO13_D08G123050v2, partial [Gossypium hirsutum]